MFTHSFRIVAHTLRMAILTSVITALALLLLQPADARDTPPFSFWRASAAGPGEKGQALFEQKCKGCHTIGGGRTVGPDLKGVTAQRDRDWLIKFTTTPDKLIAQGDPLAKQLVQQFGLPMPNLGLSEDDAREVLAYIETQSGGTQMVPAATQKSEAAPLNLAGNASAGREIFAGTAALKNGGPSCQSCHTAGGLSALGGGTLATDLTGTYARLGDQGLVSVLKTTPFPLMKDIYSSKPLTDDEIADVSAFLREASQRPAPTGQVPIFIAIGAMGALVGIGVFQLYWRRRLCGVRCTLVKGEQE